MTLSVVVPCYNEEAVLPSTAQSLTEKIDSLIAKNVLSPLSRIVFVNDGSSDNTWKIICDLYNKNPLVDGISLSRNRGHQNALLAGLMTVYKSSDAVISIDADLQDDVDAIDEMLKKFLDGADVVYGVRNDRTTDSAFKRITAQGFTKS